MSTSLIAILMLVFILILLVLGENKIALGFILGAIGMLLVMFSYFSGPL